MTRGLYETDRNAPAYLLAGSIYGPSYISFEYALSRYGLIPEAVYAVTCATFEKKKKKKYETPFGTFTYDMGQMIGPAAMLVTGMIIGGMDLRQIVANKRVWLVAFIRLALIPVIVMLVLKFSGIDALVANG